MFNANMPSLANSNAVGQAEKQKAQQEMNSSQMYSQSLGSYIPSGSSSAISQSEKQKAQQYMNSAQSYNPSSSMASNINSAIEAKKIQDARKRMNPYSGGMM